VLEIFHEDQNYQFFGENHAEFNASND